MRNEMVIEGHPLYGGDMISQARSARASDYLGTHQGAPDVYPVGQLRVHLESKTDDLCKEPEMVQFLVSGSVPSLFSQDEFHEIFYSSLGFFNDNIQGGLGRLNMAPFMTQCQTVYSGVKSNFVQNHFLPMAYGDLIPDVHDPAFIRWVNDTCTRQIMRRYMFLELKSRGFAVFSVLEKNYVLTIFDDLLIYVFSFIFFFIFMFIFFGVFSFLKTLLKNSIHWIILKIGPNGTK